MEDKKKQEFQVAETEIQESAVAKRLKAQGEAEDNPYESKITGKKVTRAENFWYQHKWHAGLIIFAVVAVVVVAVQLFTTDKPDVYFMYTGPQSMIGSQYKAFEDAVTAVMEDYNNDGKTAVSISVNTYLNETQIQAKKAADSGYYINAGDNANAFSRFQVEIMAGEHMLCFLDPDLYKTIQEGGFTPLADVFGTDDIPLGAIDDYGIHLGDTDFYQYFTGVQSLPADTVIACRTISTLNFKSQEKKQQWLDRHKSLMKAIVSFEAP